MRVIWTPEAVQDRTDVWDYIVEDNPHAAARMDDLFSDAAARLADHPRMGNSLTTVGSEVAKVGRVTANHGQFR